MIKRLTIIPTLIFLFCTTSGSFASGARVKELPYLPCEEQTFWMAVMLAESSGDPRAKTMESFGEYSIGWFQLSVSDSTRYANCPSTEEQLMNPITNMRCKDSIAQSLRARYPRESYQLALGRYWAVLRGPEWKDKMRVTAWNNFTRYAQTLGCVVTR
jgi:hypothetical protein